MANGTGTRREVLTLIAAIPILGTEAAAQTTDVRTLFTVASDYLNVPSRVRIKYAELAYYIALLNRFPPKMGDGRISDAVRTYQLLGDTIRQVEGKFDAAAASQIMESLVEAYAESQKLLWAYLKQVGIEANSSADALIQEALASMMLFYAAATKAIKAAELKYCIFPFCFGKPG